MMDGEYFVCSLFIINVLEKQKSQYLIFLNMCTLTLVSELVYCQVK